MEDLNIFDNWGEGVEPVQIKTVDDSVEKIDKKVVDTSEEDEEDGELDALLEKEKKEEEELFKDFVEDDDDDDEKEKKEKKSVDDEDVDDITGDKYRTELTRLTELGLIPEDTLESIGEDEEIDEDKYDEILEEAKEKELEEKVTSLFDGLPDIVKEINKIAMKGGDVTEYITKAINTSGIDFEDLDMDKEENQILVMKESLRKEGKDSDEIELQISFYKDANKLDSISRKKQESIIKENKNNREQILRDTEEAKKANKLKQIKLKSDFKSELKTLKDIEGIKLDSKDKKELPSYIYDKEVKLQNGQTITRLDLDILKALNDKNKKVVLAKLARSEFDLSKITQVGKQKTIKKIKKTLDSKSKSNTTNKIKKELSDYF